MKLGQPDSDFDDIDLHILALLQENCKLPLAKIGEKPFTSDSETSFQIGRITLRSVVSS